MDIRAKDYGYDIDFTVNQAGGLAVEDLTNVTEIRFQVVDVDSYTTRLDGVCVIDEPKTGGTCKYTVKSGDFDKVGNFEGGLKLTYSDGKAITTKAIFINVLKAFKSA